MVAAVTVVRELTASLQVDIKQRQRDIRRRRALDTVAFSENEPRSGVFACQLRDILSRDMKSSRGVMPVGLRQVDENLQGVCSCTGAGRFIVNSPTRGFEPIKITGRQIEVITKGVAVAECALAVLKHDCNRGKPGMGMCPEGGLGHDEVIDHDQRVHQPPEVSVFIALGLKTVTNRERVTFTLGMGFAGDACELVDMLGVHVILSLCVALTI